MGELTASSSSMQLYHLIDFRGQFRYFRHPLSGDVFILNGKARDDRRFSNPNHWSSR